MTEHLVGPILPELRAIALDLSLRRRMRRTNARGPVTEESLRKGARFFKKAMASARNAPPFVSIEAASIAGREAEWVRVGERAKAPGKVILYFHGGGFFMSSPAEHRPMTWRLARATSREVLALDYRKAPDHAFPAWIDDAYAAYEALLARGHGPEDIVLSGDSAGGNIALALAHRIKRTGAPRPDAPVLFSPWADLSCAGESFRKNARRDAMFDAEAVRAMGVYLTRACDAKDPEVSPAYGDFTGLPRMLTFAGATEVFLDDARTVTRRAREAGVHAVLYVHRHMPHVFPIFAGLLPRAKHAFDVVRSFVEHGPRAA